MTNGRANEPFEARMAPEVALYLAGLIDWILGQPLTSQSHLALEERMRLCEAIIAIGCEARSVADLPWPLLELG